MTAKDMEIIKENIICLGKIVNTYGKGRYNSQLSIMQDIIFCIDADISEENKQKYIVSRYELLFPPSGGLSDFFIHHDNFEKRKELNIPLENAENNLWNVIRKYV